MKPTLLAATAMALYALINVIIEQKLSKHTTSAVILCIYSVILILALTRFSYMRSTGDQINFPTGLIFVLVLAVGVLHFFADYCYYLAYTAGGTLMSITTIAIMLPIFSSFAKFAWTNCLPSAYQLTGYVLAVIAIYLVGKGN